MTRSIYNAVGIEHTMARFFGGEVGARGQDWDADVFRHGDPSDIADLIERVADRTQERAAKLKFSAAEQENGGNQKLIQVGVSRLRSYAQSVRVGQAQHEDPRWEMLGATVMIIDALLSHLKV